MKCPNCGTENQNTNAKYCFKCGSRIGANQNSDFPHNISTVWPEWKIEKQLGRGSYGVVYQAVRGDGHMQSRAAIKVISVPGNHSEITSLMAEGLDVNQSRDYFRGIVNEFTSEISIMESFKGAANIVVIDDYKVVERADEIGWDILMRMELLKPFNDYIQSHTMSENEVIDLGIDICTALEICGTCNVIHRDVKPENIFINNFGTFKLGDFGTAKVLENMSGSLSHKGTPNYIAPEVVNGTKYDFRADIYSLGLVLYRLLNENRLPFLDTEQQQLNPNARTAAVERRLRGEPLSAPCKASAAMAEVILRACAYDPEQRYHSPGEMKRALEYARMKQSDDGLDLTRKVRRIPNRDKHPKVEPPRKRSPIWLVSICLVAMVLLAALVLGTIYLLRDMDSAGKTESSETSAVETAPPATEPPTEVIPTMPNCEGWNYWDAVAYFDSFGCDVTCEYVFDAIVPAEMILAQTVPEGTPLNAQSAITFTVSKGADICPYEYSQKITVTAPMGATAAQLVLYEWDNGGWVPQFTCAATVGRNGIGSNFGEGKGYTPLGIFKLGVALSQKPIDNAAWPIHYVTNDTCIVDDVTSSYYNTIQSIASLPYGVHYDAMGKTLTSGSTDICLYIEHNGSGLSPENVIPGKGSAITLCGKRNGYSAHTAGCIDITQSDMRTLLTMLDYAQNPHVETVLQ